MGLTSGTKLGPYEIVSPLGAGGMGEVYRARDTRLDRDVAIKVLPANLSSDPVLRQRLEREAKAISKLSHPHVCTLHDIGRQDGVDFLVMEYLEGSPGAATDQGTASGGTDFALFGADGQGTGQSALAGHYSSRSEAVECNADQDRRQADGFRSGERVGPGSTSRRDRVDRRSDEVDEQGHDRGDIPVHGSRAIGRQEADARTDVFALGEVIYEMATGKPAFSAKSRASLIVAILTTEPVPIS